MSIADYSDLLGQCTEYTGRDDFGHMFPRLVSYCESKLNRALRVGNMEALAVLTTDAYGAVALPSDYLEMREVAGDNGNPIRLMDLQHLDYEYRFNSGTAVGYAITGSTMYVVPVQAASQFTVTYYAKIPALTVSNTTNWLLTDSPLLYLYGVSAEVVGWALASGKDADGAKLAGLREAFAGELAAYEKLDKSRRFSNSQIVPRGVKP